MGMYFHLLHWIGIHLLSAASYRTLSFPSESGLCPTHLSLDYLVAFDLHIMPV